MLQTRALCLLQLRHYSWWSACTHFGTVEVQLKCSKEAVTDCQHATGKILNIIPNLATKGHVERLVLTSELQEGVIGINNWVVDGTRVCAQRSRIAEHS